MLLAASDAGNLETSIHDSKMIMIQKLFHSSSTINRHMLVIQRDSLIHFPSRWTSAFYPPFRWDDSSRRCSKRRERKKWFHCQTFPDKSWKTRKSSHRKSIHRKFAQHSFAFLPPFQPPPLSMLCSFFLQFFMPRKGRKKVTMNWKGKEFIDFRLDAVLSQHFNSFVTIFRSNKPFCAVFGGGESEV